MGIIRRLLGMFGGSRHRTGANTRTTTSTTGGGLFGKLRRLLP